MIATYVLVIVFYGYSPTPIGIQEPNKETCETAKAQFQVEMKTSGTAYCALGFLK